MKQVVQAGSTYLSDRLQAAGEFDLVDAVVDRFAVGGTFRHGALAATTAHSHAVDDVTCRGKKKQKKRHQQPDPKHLSYRDPAGTPHQHSSVPETK